MWLMILPYGILLQKMLFDFTTAFTMTSIALLPMELLAKTTKDDLNLFLLIFGVVIFMPLIQGTKIGIRFLRETVDQNS